MLTVWLRGDAVSSDDAFRSFEEPGVGRAARACLVGACLWLVACGSAAGGADEVGTGGGGLDGGEATGGSGGGVEGGPSPGSGGSAGSYGSGGVGTGGVGTGGVDSGGAGTGGDASSGGADGGGGSGNDGCPFAGRVTYELNDPASWPADVTQLITAAMDEAVEHYNCYADLEKAITVDYNPGVPTAEANVDGWLSFGSNQAYMQVATAMHEVAHTLGVGYFPWAELMQDGLWIGPNVDAYMKALPASERDPDEYSQRDYIRGDGQHFWPYGLNQASEHQSEWSLINHVRIVAAMQQDKQAYLNGEL